MDGGARVCITCPAGREKGQKNSGLVFQTASPQKFYKGTRKVTFINKMNIEIGFGLHL